MSQPPTPSSPFRVALVDDETTLLATVGEALRKAGYEVEAHGDGAAAWEAFQRRLPDLAILDILMPRMDGLELCRRLRGLSEVLPIVFLTSRDEEIDRIVGLELGADDYLTKPFSVRELLARVKVLFRRLALLREQVSSPHQPPSQEIVSAGPLVLDMDRYQAFWNGQAVALTVTEFRLLATLARRPGHVKTRDQLLTEAYPHDTYLAERTIDSHIKRLRRKLEAAVPDFDAIETVYGLGYRYRVAR